MATAFSYLISAGDIFLKGVTIRPSMASCHTRNEYHCANARYRRRGKPSIADAAARRCQGKRHDALTYASPSDRAAARRVGDIIADNARAK